MIMERGLVCQKEIEVIRGTMKRNYEEESER